MLRNTGVLPTSFRFIFPKDGEDEPENWVDSDLLSQKELTRNLILENRLFQVFPKEGRLDANAETEILICYQHKFVGEEFRLPVILQIVDGKAVVLAFSGCTLDYNTPRLEVLPSPPPFEPGTFGFRDVALGVDNPPVQYMQLRNSSDSCIDWALDVSDIERLNAENFDFGIFELLDSPVGVIEPGEIAFLRFVFRPLEEKQYSAQISFTIVGDGGNVNVLLVGSGYVPKRDELPNELSIPLPPKQIIKIPNQPVLCFIERLAAGAIPTGCNVTSIVVLQNVHKKPWTFNWQIQASTLACEAIAIVPPHGELEPGDIVLCKVTVMCSGPMWFDTDVQCLITEPIVEEEPEEIAEDAADKKPDTAGTVKSSSLKPKARQFRESVITRTIGHSKSHDSNQKDVSGGVKFKDTVRSSTLHSDLLSFISNKIGCRILSQGACVQVLTVAACTAKAAAASPAASQAATARPVVLPAEASLSKHALCSKWLCRVPHMTTACPSACKRTLGSRCFIATFSEIWKSSGSTERCRCLLHLRLSQHQVMITRALHLPYLINTKTLTFSVWPKTSCTRCCPTSSLTQILPLRSASCRCNRRTSTSPARSLFHVECDLIICAKVRAVDDAAVDAVSPDHPLRFSSRGLEATERRRRTCRECFPCCARIVY
jgi:hypothetical protein